MSKKDLKLQALNPLQDEYIKVILNSVSGITDDIVLATGVAGSSKTYIPTVIAGHLLANQQIKEIIVARPPEGAGPSVGFFKGTKEEKLEGWCLPVLKTLRKLYGYDTVAKWIEEDKIVMHALEQTKGLTWDDAFVLVDETEDVDVAVMKTLVTRPGENCTMVLTGDIEQQDIKEYSGLEYVLNLAKFYDVPCSHIDFNDWKYNVRSTASKKWGMAMTQCDRQTRKHPINS